ncbi:hemogen [Ammospiza nelsoni]|uniref:hemogen n=1 Tax=Ammospiza caudacuta TaxID=2857398 RepID=UPI0027381DAD|nr:hemogen [Ammospiza caudacuta]XP_059347910.1 hemogen [Ammospiza nelsoni]
MESLGKDHASSDSSLPPSAACEEYAVPDVIITRRLRDRELLRKRKAEALEKDSAQWVMRDYKNEQQRRARRAKRGRGCQTVVKAVLESEPAVEPQPDPEEKGEPVPSEPEPSEPALPEAGFQQQPPMLPIQNMVGGLPAVAVEGELADRSSDPAGEEDVLKPAEADILEEFNTPLENDHQDNEYIPHILY